MSKGLKLKNKYKIILSLILIFLFSFTMYKIFPSSAADTLEDGDRVAENSELTYYIDVYYDGVDATPTTSSDTAVAKVNSGVIYVEDQIPEGLIFQGFVQTSDNTIGAVLRSDTSTGCAGYVINDESYYTIEDDDTYYAGLFYDSSEHKVYFRVKNLQAGCKLTVGIITKTPYLSDLGVDRIDFYNTANGREDTFNVNSNTTHAFMGEEEENLYNVVYSYESEDSNCKPDGAPDVPTIASYIEGATVSVENNLTYKGYDFSGWKTSDVSVSSGKFTMPSNTVTFTGCFSETQKETYSVTYSVENAPSGYVVPTEKSYYEDDDVEVDSLKEGDIIDGYKFTGWTISDNVKSVDTSTDGVTTFTMPAENVTITGSFELVTYIVSYAYQGSVPSGAEALLPASKSYTAGTIVSVEAKPELEGYIFIGWYSDDTFTMPENDLIIYGEWQQITGTFIPTIKKELSDSKSCYKSGDEVKFKITVTNNESYAIKDVILKETLDNVSFTEGEGYSVLTSNYVSINSIAANSSVEVSASYTAGDDSIKEYENIVEVISATGDTTSGSYTLDTTNTLSASVKFTIGNIELDIKTVDKNNNDLEGVSYTLYSDESLETSLSSGVEIKNLCPGTYYLKQIRTADGYKILSDALEIVVNDDGTIKVENYNVENESGIGTLTIVLDEINILPNTGGIGNVPFVVFGLLIIILALVLYWILVKKKKDDDKNKGGK